MAVFKDIPRFDGSGITEYYRVNDGKIVRLSSDYDFLDDKPMINGVVLEGDLSTADLNIPVGDITQLKTEIKDNIVNAINELQTEADDFEKFITDKVNAIISFTIVWVAELPAIKDAKPNTVYLVPKKSMIEDDNYCEEFIFTDGHWEKIGDTKVDLSGYYTKEEINSITQALEGQVNIILQDYATKAELEERASELERQVDVILEDYATKEEVNDVTEELRNDITDIITNKVGDLEELVVPESDTVVEALNQIYNTKNSYYLVSQLDSNARLIEIGQAWLNDFINGQHSDVYYLREWSGNIIFRYIKMTDTDIDYNQSKMYWDFDSSIYNYGKYNQPRSTFRFTFTLTSDNKITGVSVMENQNFLLDAYSSNRKGIGKWGLATDNTTSYTPSSDYNPATKKYVDDTVNSIDLSPYATIDYVDANDLLNNKNCFYYLEGGIRFDMTSTNSTNAEIITGLTNIMNDYYPKYLANVNQCAVIFVVDNTNYSNGRMWKIAGTGTQFYFDYPYSQPGFATDPFGLKGYLKVNGSWNSSTQTYTVNSYSINRVSYTPTAGHNPANKTYVDSAIRTALQNIHSFEIAWVDTLPTSNIATHTIYMVPSDKVEDNNSRDEYIYVNNAWEMIGTTKVDLSNYYTKPEVDEKVDNLYLRCNREEYEAMSQEERDSFLVAIVDDIAVLSEQDLTNIAKVLGGNTSTNMEIDISTNEAIAITDKIIGGTE